jgi:hypothetical protein
VTADADRESGKSSAASSDGPYRTKSRATAESDKTESATGPAKDSDLTAAESAASTSTGSAAAKRRPPRALRTPALRTTISRTRHARPATSRHP